MIDRGGASSPLVELTASRLREFIREPEALFWVFVFPILLALALGIAFRTGREEPVRAGVERTPRADQAAGAEVDTADTDAIVGALRSAHGIDVTVLKPSEVEAALRNGRVALVVRPGTPPTYRYDATRTESRLARLVVDQALQRAAGRVDRWKAGDEAVLTKGSRYIDWLIPGLLGMNIMGTSMWGLGFSIVQARTRKLLKRLLATPVARSDYLLAQLLARLVFLGLEVGVLLVFARVAFGVPVNGSIVALFAVAVIGSLAFGGLALLVAARPRTIEAVSGWMNFVMLPMWVLSGTFFASSNFPSAMQPFIRLLPLTALNDALRGVMLEGQPIVALGSQVAILAAWGVIGFAVAVKIFRWR